MSWKRIPDYSSAVWKTLFEKIGFGGKRFRSEFRKSWSCTWLVSRNKSFKYSGAKLLRASACKNRESPVKWKYSNFFLLVYQFRFSLDVSSYSEISSEPSAIIIDIHEVLQGNIKFLEYRSVIKCKKCLSCIIYKFFWYFLILSIRNFGNGRFVRWTSYKNHNWSWS
jgi:hypothetical protein